MGDGIEGTRKRLWHRKSLQKTSNNQILSAKDVFAYCRNKISDVDFIYVDQEAINTLLRSDLQMQKQYQELGEPRNLSRRSLWHSQDESHLSPNNV